MQKTKSRGSKNGRPENIIEKKEDKTPRISQREKYKGELDIRDLNWTDKQNNIINCGLDNKNSLLFCDGIWGTGKAQPLNAEVITPNGIVQMKDLKIGDSVSTPDGGVANIVGIFPQGIKKIVKVIFSDGTSTECCEDHLWQTQTNIERNHRNKISKSRKTYVTPQPGKVRSTKEIKQTLRANKRGDVNHSIPITEPVFFEEQDIPLDPYILGALLGDGSFRHNINITTVDIEILAYFNQFLPIGCSLGKQQGISYHIIDEFASWTTKNRIKSILESYGLWDKYSHEKFIPDVYKFNSVENRLAILRGLMDTDGTTDGHNTTYSTSSYQLALDVKFLVESLGGTSGITKKSSFLYINNIKKKCKDSYRVTVKMQANCNPFLLPRKSKMWIAPTKYPPRRYIVAIEDVGEQECQCILIDSKDHLYLTNNFIVTHNTLLAVYMALHLIKLKKADQIIYLRAPIESSTSKLGYLKGDLDQKFDMYVEPLREKLEELLPPSQVNSLINDDRILGLPVGFIRGRSWNCKVVIVDEASCLTREELLLVISRIGKFSKCFIVGDQFQSDIGNKSGFKGLIELFNDQESKDNGVFTFELKEQNDIMRSNLLKFVMKKLNATSDTKVKITSMFPND